jgi:hypothetical protein
VSSCTAASLQRRRDSSGGSDRRAQRAEGDSSGESDRRAQDDEDEMPLRCQQELHTQGAMTSPQIKSGGLRPGERGGHALGPPVPNHDSIAQSTVMHVPHSRSVGDTSCDTCQTIRNFPDIFEPTQRSKMTRVEAH